MNNNLPIKVVMQRTTDIQKNNPGGKPKFFGEVTKELEESISKQLEQLLDFYSNLFTENSLIPAVGKIKMKEEAIAKSHKPNDLCRKCPIIGGGDLDEIYIKVTRLGIQETITFVKDPPSQKFSANMTAIKYITPVQTKDIISPDLTNAKTNGEFEKFKSNIKVKLFDFEDEFDNSQVTAYVNDKLKVYNLLGKSKVISYGDKIKYLKIGIESYSDVEKIASINGVKSIDFFQKYTLPKDDYDTTKLKINFNDNQIDSDIQIGIIDSGISINNPYLSPYVVVKDEYVSKDYQNNYHATFIASMIQYGNKLNDIFSPVSKKFKFVDIAAIPNGDEKVGIVDSISEEELMEIIDDVMSKYSKTTKIWNLSLGINDKICNGKMSDLGIFLDYIQEKYNVQIFVSSGNIDSLPLRQWPAQNSIGERDRIISPADSVRAVTVGSIALLDSQNSFVNKNEPSPFSRRGPGANYTIKPDLVDYGGNLSTNLNITGLGMKGMDIYGNIVEGNGTSYSTPRVVQKFASIYDDMLEKDLLTAKALLIHSARMNSRNLIEKNQNNIKYYGFGMPSENIDNILHCSDDKVTLIFKQKIAQGYHLEMYDFPFPPSLIYNGKYHGEIGMTLAYNPILDDKYGHEYCRINIDASFGTYEYKEDGNVEFHGQVPLESTWDDKYEKERVEHGFKWSPVKSYFRKISNKGINEAFTSLVTAFLWIHLQSYGYFTLLLILITAFLHIYFKVVHLQAESI